MYADLMALSQRPFGYEGNLMHKRNNTKPANKASCIVSATDLEPRGATALIFIRHAKSWIRHPHGNVAK
jgi:hypothetical protein